MQRCFVFMLFLYGADYALATSDPGLGEHISPDLKTDIDNYVAGIVSALTEKYENRLNELEYELATQKQRIEKLEANEWLYKEALAVCQSNAGEITDVKEDTEEIVGENAIGVESTEEQGSLRKNRIHTPGESRMRKATSSIRRSTENKVAFFASLSYFPPSESAPKIPFDKVVTNQGNAYHVNNGSFIAPVAGTYMISLTLNTGSIGTFGYIKVKGATVAKLHLEKYDQSSQTVVVALNQGDDVHVEVTVDTIYISLDRFSTFAGFLLYENSPSSPIVG